jgi:hypothetical protein
VSVETVSLLAMPVAFNVAFGLLAARFDHHVVWSVWLFATGVALVT